MKKHTITYSFVVPIFNDGTLAQDFVSAFHAVFSNYLETQSLEESVELIFVDDGSTDSSVSYLIILAERFRFIRVIQLSSNFGQHAAFCCGYEHARGQFVGALNVDMQDPPDQIPKMLTALKETGADFALSVRESRAGSRLDSITSILFNNLLSRLSGQNIPANSGTLRIMNRRFVDALNSLPERRRFLPALEAWMGFSQVTVQIRHQERKSGRSSYTFSKRLMMAVDALISFSDRPLRWMVLLGFLMAILGALATVFIVIGGLFFIDFLAGYSSLMSVILMFSGFQILVVGLTGLYVGATLAEAKRRPLYLVNRRVNFED